MTSATARSQLQAATRDIHERLHALPAFVALLEGRMDRAEYRDLLCRLWTFHAGLERHLVADDRRIDRVGRLRADLETLGLCAEEIDDLPIADFETLPSSGPEALGAAYVQDGSVLGGAVLARALDPLLGADHDGRRFFTPCPDGSRAWRIRLAEIEEVSDDPLQVRSMIEGAKATFAAFERIMLR